MCVDGLLHRFTSQTQVRRIANEEDREFIFQKDVSKGQGTAGGGRGNGSSGFFKDGNRGGVGGGAKAKKLNPLAVAEAAAAIANRLPPLKMQV